MLQKRELAMDHLMLALLLFLNERAGCLEASFFAFKLTLHRDWFGVLKGLAAGQHAPDGGQQFACTGSGRNALTLAFALEAFAKVAVGPVDPAEALGGLGEGPTQPLGPGLRNTAVPGLAGGGTLARR